MKDFNTCIASENFPAVSARVDLIKPIANIAPILARTRILVKEPLPNTYPLSQPTRSKYRKRLDSVQEKEIRGQPASIKNARCAHRHYTPSPPLTQRLARRQSPSSSTPNGGVNPVKSPFTFAS